MLSVSHNTKQWINGALMVTKTWHHPTRGHSYPVYGVQNIFVALQQCKGNQFRNLSGITLWFYIIDSYSYINNTKGTHCLISLTAVVK